MADEFEFEGGDQGLGGDDEEQEEESWEKEVRETYEKGKSIQAKDKDGAIKCFTECVKKDQQKGRWTFKSHKSNYRVCLMHKAEDEMLQHYQKALEADYKERTRADVDKMINKISDRSTHLSSACRKRVAEQSRDYLAKQYKADAPSASDKLYFNLTQRLAQFAVDDKRLDDLQKLVDEMYKWCGTGKEAESRRGTQLMSVYAFHIQLCTERDELKELRNLYQKATALDSAVAPPKVLGVIHESGAKMYLRQRQWTQAFNSMQQAFRSYDQAGDGRKLSCLQYLVVAAMVSESAMNPFDMPEAKSYSGEPEIVVMTQLYDVAGTSKSPLTGVKSGAASASSGSKRDVHQFIGILNDPKRSKYLTRDPFLYSLIEPLIARVRGVGLLELVKPYTAIKLSSIGVALATTAVEAEKLAARLILEGRLQGLIDQVHGHLYLTGSGGGEQQGAEDDETVGSRPFLLQQLLDSCTTLRANVLSSLRR